MEPISATLMTFGVVLLVVSWIYLIFLSFEDDFTWGLCAVFLPFVAYFYAAIHWRRAQGVLGAAALGLAAILLA